MWFSTKNPYKCELIQENAYLCFMEKKQDITKLVCGYNTDHREHYLNDVGAAMVYSRKSKGLTQSELGTYAGLGKTEICRIEKSGNPTIGTVCRIYAAMKNRVMFTVEPDVSGKEEREMTEDLVLSISEFAENKGITIHSAYAYLKRFGSLDFYYITYDPKSEDTLGETVIAFETVTRRNGGKL